MSFYPRLLHRRPLWHGPPLTVVYIGSFSQWLRPTSVALLCLTFRLQRCIVLHVRSVDARYNVRHANLDLSSEVWTSLTSVVCWSLLPLGPGSLTEAYSSRVQSTISCVYTHVWNRPHTPASSTSIGGCYEMAGFRIFRCGSSGEISMNVHTREKRKWVDSGSNWGPSVQVWYKYFTIMLDRCNNQLCHRPLNILNMTM